LQYLCWALPLLWCVPCFAEEPGVDQRTPFRVQYTGSSICSSASELSRAIVDSAPHTRSARAGESAVTLRVSYEFGDGVSGQLDLEERSGQATTRQVHAADCREATAALALIAVVLLEPLQVPHSTELPKRSRPQRLSRFGSARRHWLFGGEAALALEGTVAPRLALAEVVGVSALFQHQGLLEPMFALSLNRLSSERAQVTAGRAQFSWVAARLSVCPLRVALNQALRLRSCAMFDGGVLRASGESSFGRRTVRAPWWAVGGAARIEWSLVSALVIAAQVGVIAPLSQGQFYFAPKQRNTVFVVPALGAVGQVGLGLRF
jgi:hypothetical protein